MLPVSYRGGMNKQSDSSTQAYPPLGVLFQNAIWTEIIHSLRNVLSITMTLPAIG